MAGPVRVKPTNKTAQQPNFPGPVTVSDQSEDIGVQSFQTTGIDPQTCQQIVLYFDLTANTRTPVILNLVGQSLSGMAIKKERPPSSST